MGSYSNIKEYMRNQRRERVSAKQREQKRKDIEQQRKQQALERVRKEARDSLHTPIKNKSKSIAAPLLESHPSRSQHSRDISMEPLHDGFSVKFIHSLPPQDTVPDISCVESDKERKPPSMSSPLPRSVAKEADFMAKDLFGKISTDDATSCESDWKGNKTTKNQGGEKMDSHFGKEQQSRHVHPKRRWELQPLKEALERFVQLPLNNQNVSWGTTRTGLHYTNKYYEPPEPHSASAHSIFSFLPPDCIGEVYCKGKMNHCSPLHPNASHPKFPGTFSLCETLSAAANQNSTSSGVSSTTYESNQPQHYKEEYIQVTKLASSTVSESRGNATSRQSSPDSKTTCRDSSSTQGEGENGKEQFCYNEHKIPNSQKSDKSRNPNIHRTAKVSYIGCHQSGMGSKHRAKKPHHYKGEPVGDSYLDELVASSERDKVEKIEFNLKDNACGANCSDIFSSDDEYDSSFISEG